jgi:hypothetical protein
MGFFSVIDFETSKQTLAYLSFDILTIAPRHGTKNGFVPSQVEARPYSDAT